jgi:hypothetical protein
VKIPASLKVLACYVVMQKLYLLKKCEVGFHLDAILFLVDLLVYSSIQALL